MQCAFRSPFWTDEAKDSACASLAPASQSDWCVKTLREMERDPFRLDTIPLQPPAEGLYRVRVDDYRIVFQPGPGWREITVVRIGHRESVYEGLERPRDDG